MSEYRDSLKAEFQDEEYRYAYAEDFLNTSIATQIKVLRELRELSQTQLAEKLGTKQAGISRIESVNYSSWKTETLRKLARALGVRLRITFETFGTLIDDAAQFSRGSLQRPSFENDPAINPTLEEAVLQGRENIKSRMKLIISNPQPVPQMSLFAEERDLHEVPQYKRLDNVSESTRKLVRMYA